MTTLEIWLVAVSLAMDCLAVSIASGITMKKVNWRVMLCTAFSFGFFQSAMPFVGWLGASRFSHLIEQVDHWIAFGLLLFLGGKMVLESFKHDDCKHEYNLANPKVLLALSVATSIDALAVGVTFAFLGMNDIQAVLPPVLVIGFVAFVLSLAGLLFGVFFGCRHNLRMELWGGLVLVAIGVKILVEHLSCQ